MQYNIDPYANCGSQIMHWADDLAQHTETPGTLTRSYLAPAHHGAAAQRAGNNEAVDPSNF